MSEVPFDTDSPTNVKEETNEVEFDPVCADIPRIYDSCGAKDCVRDLTVFFTPEDQALVDTATSVRVTKVSVLTATVNVDSVAFHRGYYSVDAVMYFAVCSEVYTGTGALPTTITGLATYAKRAVLYGSEGNVKIFSSDQEPSAIDAADFDCCTCTQGALPTATVQVSCPISLAAELLPVEAPVILPYVPENVAQFFDGGLVVPNTLMVSVTLGIFSIMQLSRRVQLMMPSYDYCVPRKECASPTADPCETFNKIEFPTDSFFPPSSMEADTTANNGVSYGCCN